MNHYYIWIDEIFIHIVDDAPLAITTLVDEFIINEWGFPNVWLETRYEGAKWN